MANDLSDELERAYRDLQHWSPTASGPWRVSGEGTVVLDTYGRVIASLDVGVSALPLPSRKALARLIALLPDVCDADLRCGVGVRANVSRRGEEGQVARNAVLHAREIRGEPTESPVTVDDAHDNAVGGEE